MWGGAVSRGEVSPKDVEMPKARRSPAAPQKAGPAAVLLAAFEAGRKREQMKHPREDAASKRPRVVAPAAEAPAVPALSQPAPRKGSAAPVVQPAAPTPHKAPAAHSESAVPAPARAAQLALPSPRSKPASSAARAQWEKASAEVRSLIGKEHVFGNRTKGAEQAAKSLHANLENLEAPEWQPVLQPMEQLKQAFESFMVFFQEQDNQACEAAEVTPKQWMQVSHQLLLLYHLSKGVLDQDQRTGEQFGKWREALAAASQETGIRNCPANNKRGTPLCAHHC